MRVSLLDEDSHQFRDVQGRFRSFWPVQDQERLTVQTIEAVSNPERQVCFKMVEADHRSRLARLPPGSHDRPAGENTVELLHGSSHENLRNIALDGFNLESSPANGAIYGTGAYLT